MRSSYTVPLQHSSPLLDLNNSVSRSDSNNERGSGQQRQVRVIEFNSDQMEEPFLDERVIERRKLRLEKRRVEEAKEATTSGGDGSRA